jgi:hypothetical protein
MSLTKATNMQRTLKSILQAAEDHDVGACHEMARLALTDYDNQILTGPDFREIAAKMMNIDKHTLVEAGVITGSPCGSDWDRFNNNPLIFICKLGDDQLDILAAMVSPYKTPV